MIIKISKATKQDVGGIIKMIKQTCDYHYEIDKYYKPFSYYKNLEKEVSKSLKDKNMIFLLAKLDTKIIGYCEGGIGKDSNYTLPRQIGYIYTLIIENKYRRKGVGKKMLNKLMKWFKNKKVKNIELEADARNNIGIDFWKNNKFFTYRLKMRQDL